MFRESSPRGTRSLMFMASFHVGLPLAICETQESSTWEDISKDLTAAFEARGSGITPVKFNYEEETHFPLGRPIMLQYARFAQVFNASHEFGIEPSVMCESDNLFENLVWILPSGLVLIMGKMRVQGDTAMDIDRFIRIVEERYLELTYMFVDIAEVIYSVFDVESLRSLYCCWSDISNVRRALECRDDYFLKTMTENKEKISSVTDFLRSNREIRDLYERILIDVYYVEWYLKRDDHCNKIDYRQSFVDSCEPHYVLIIAIAYSSFATLVWLQRQLCELTLAFQDELTSGSLWRGLTSLEIKMFRIFCLQFVSQSAPISVRLTREYMMCLEDCWKEFRMHTLVDQINGQLDTLEEMLAWAEEIRKEERNFKIAFAAILLSVISLSAVAAQLISTIDVYSQLGVGERTLLTMVGFVSGVFASVAILFVPVRRWILLRGRRRKRTARRAKRGDSIRT